MDRIEARLSSSNNKFLSFGGRLVLLKFVLPSLPVYFLSFFKAPAGIISSIESLFKRYFGGWCNTLFPNVDLINNGNKFKQKGCYTSSIFH